MLTVMFSTRKQSKMRNRSTAFGRLVDEVLDLWVVYV
jgi:hypothetical protein